MGKLDPHAEYVQYVVCLRLTVPGGDIDSEWLRGALKHLRSRECELCQHEKRTGCMHANEADFLEMCKDPKNPSNIVRELVEAIERKYNGSRVGHEHGPR